MLGGKTDLEQFKKEIKILDKLKISDFFDSVRELMIWGKSLF
jgi:hypothetical protein